MHPYPPTLIVRHRRENLKKCSLSGLEKRADMQFFTYPKCSSPLVGLTAPYIALTLGAKELCLEDAEAGLFLIDATWRLEKTIRQQTAHFDTLLQRSLPSHFRTAYPRRQDDCTDPEKGLASVEALFLAYLLLGRNTDGILDSYHWRQSFLKLNSL